MKFLWDGEDIATKSTVQPAFYVFTRDGGGFVIIAGDDNVKPILAFSDRNEFRVEGMPDNVKWWMDRMKAYIRSVDVQAADVRDAWTHYAATKAGPLPESSLSNRHEDFFTPEWGQGTIYYGREVFSTKCPPDGTEHSVTGCVATALAEVLTTLSGIYPVMPTHPLVASVEPYTTANGRIPATVDGFPYLFTATYDWAGLRKLTNRDAIVEVVKASQNSDLLIAKPADELLQNMDQLLADIGAMMHATYSRLGTGAYAEDAPDTLMRYMGFHHSGRSEYARNYTRWQWEEKLKNEIEKRPVLYWGASGAFGHAFVFDGYAQCQGDDVFHVNFGWEGDCNGYYYEYNLDTYGDPNWNFSYDCGAAFDFYPDSDVPYTPPVKPGYLTFYTSPGMAYLSSDDEGATWKAVPSLGEGGRRFSVLGYLCNLGDLTLASQIKVALLDKDNTFLEYVYSSDNFELGPFQGWETYTFDLTVTKPLSFGDKLVIQYWDSTSDSWRRVAARALDCNFVSELPVFPAAFIKTESTYSVGDIFPFALFNHDVPYAGTVWIITKPDGSKAVYEQLVDGHMELTQSGTYKIEAAVAQAAGASTEQTIVTYITVH